jgi:hypothetical protein
LAAAPRSTEWAPSKHLRTNVLASCSSKRLRVSAINGAASDSVSLISVLQFGQMMVGSVMVRVSELKLESSF